MEAPERHQAKLRLVATAWLDYKATIKAMKAEADAELEQRWSRYADERDRASQEYT